MKAKTVSFVITLAILAKYYDTNSTKYYTDRHYAPACDV